MRAALYARVSTDKQAEKYGIPSQREAERMRDLLIAEIDARGVADISVIGPAPAYVQRLRGRFRWQLILRGSELSVFLSPVHFRQGWTIDIDPVSLI